MKDDSRNAEAFQKQYGPWAVIGGASDGTGEEFARQLAAKGLNCVLVSRRRPMLEKLAGELRDESGIETRILAMDLSLAAAGRQLCTAVADLEVGLFVANAGAGIGGLSFVDGSLEQWQTAVNMNIHTPMEACHGLAEAMLERGRGGLLLMGSGVALGGQPGVAVYAASKAFSLTLAESMWAEFKPRGVDVLNVVAPLINTPKLRQGFGEDMDVSRLPAMVEPDELVRIALEQLPEGPCYIFPAGPEEGIAGEVTERRRARVEAATEIARAMFEKS
jgi:short-subunit dehydrogenase